MSLHPSNEVIDRPQPGFAPHESGLPHLASSAGRWDCDPLDPDAPEDETVTTSSRRLLRMMIAAAETGARFAREGVDQDPAAWMLTPRAVFDGIEPIDACQDLKQFNRCIVMHAIGTHLDADPRSIDALLEDDGEDDDSDIDIDGTFDGFVAGEANLTTAASSDDGDARLPKPLLLTCWLNVLQGRQRLFAFCAIVTDRPADLIDRVVERYGRDAAQAEFAVGYDNSTPLATAMISGGLADTLTMAAADPQSALAAGLDVVVEQRFADWTLSA